MTSAPEAALDDGTPTAGQLRPFELFTRNCQALWATTYGLDLSLINEFLLAQLGDSPINLTVLSDATRLADTLDRTRDPASLNAVNRRWLLRGVRYGTGAFHPKSYLAVTPSRATLLVGSGNLNSDGLGAGKEVFTKFVTGTAQGDAAVQTWLEWVRRLVTDADDLRLAERFADLKERLGSVIADEPAATDPGTRTVGVLHNLHRPLLPQLVELAADGSDSVDEVLLTAPFYDEDVEAAGALVDQLAPRRVQVWAAADTNVDGSALLRRLGPATTDLKVWRYTPDRFVHAKLIGVVRGQRAVLLSGSANLSRAGLTLTPDKGGNVELAVFADLPSAVVVRATYLPPGTSAELWPAAELADLSFTRDPDTEPIPVQLHAAEMTGDEGLSLRTTPAPQAEWMLTDGIRREDIRPTVDSRAEAVWRDGARLVWLCDQGGTPLSNRVVVDDAGALAAALRSGADATTAERPAELHLSDVDTPLGRLLEDFHRHFIMDVSELTDRSSAADATEEEAEAGAADELWERLQREQFTRDPRVGIYRGMGHHMVGSGDPLLDLLELLRNRAPGADAAGSPFRATVTYMNDLAERWHNDDDADGQDEQKVRSRWSIATRVRVRAGNVLRRWAHAQSEPQLAWIDVLAPVKNLRSAVVLLAALYALRRQDRVNPARPPTCPLTEEDLADLAYRWIAAIVGSGEGDGWIASVKADTRAAASAFTADETLRGICAALTCLAVAPGKDVRKRLIHWQPVAQAADELGMMAVNEHAVEVLLEAGAEMNAEQAAERLLQCRTFIDDDLWCARTAASLSLNGLAIDAPPGGATVLYGATIHVDGIDDPLLDPRAVRLIAAVRAYGRKPGVALYALDKSWRLVVPHDESAVFKATSKAAPVSSEVAVDDVVIELLLDEHGVLASLFPQREAA